MTPNPPTRSEVMAQQNQAPNITLPRGQHGTVMRTLDRWRECGVIDEETRARLAASTSIAAFDWQRTARYAFIIAISCIVIALGAILADKVLMDLLMRVFNAPAGLKSAFFVALSAMLFGYGLRSRRKHPHRSYGNEAVFFLGVLALAAAVFFLGAAMDTGSGRFSVLLLIASVLYALLGLWFPSKLVWVFGLVSLGAWMGAETGYASGWGAYYLGMNYPFRFLLLGAALTALALFGEHASSPPNMSTAKARLLSMSPQTKVMGLLYGFIALWIMSIFGNYGDVAKWQLVRQYELLHWSLLFGAASIAAFWYGLKRDDGVLRGFGLTFLFINLYTRFFEYFWDSIHKAAFFAVLAASFWYIGNRAESIWHFGLRKPHTQRSMQTKPQSKIN
jgi:MFS family permease